MNEPNTYRIETVSDFLKVPPERQHGCLEEFADFLDTARCVAEMLSIVGDVVGVDPQTQIGAFVWIDDGKRDRTVTIVPQASPSLPARGEGEHE
jgi:hypothetical protein